MSKINEKHEVTVNDRTHFGFWVYIMTDCILFATLFATFAVLRNNTFGGPSASDIFSLPYVFVQTIFLLTSSLTMGMALLAGKNQQKRQALVWLAVTSIFGLAFLGLEINEFATLYAEGYSWQRSAFFSSYFALVGTHGLHIIVGLLWVVVMAFQIRYKGLSMAVNRRISKVSVFWHFLDVVWIFIFSVVYLLGAVS